jgi:hypothetical protein
MTTDRREALFIGLIILIIAVITTVFNSPYGIADWAIGLP